MGLPRTTFTEILDHVVRMGFRPSVVIDVGVAYGTFDLYEKFPNSKFLLIEPIKEWEVVLKEISRKYGAKYVLAAAGAKPGKIVINVHSDLSASSIFQEVEGSHVDGIPREVRVVTLDDLCS
jgi:FkbM family methyltransferase